MASSDLKDGLSLIGDFVVSQLIKVIDNEGHRTTGQLQESIRSEVHESGSGFVIVIYATDYAKFVDKGTPSGTMVSVDALAQWVENKGIATGEIEIKSLAFAIQRKIFNEGTIQFRQNKKGFIEVMLDESAKNIFKMVLELFKTQFTLSLSNTIRNQKQTFES